MKGLGISAKTIKIKFGLLWLQDWRYLNNIFAGCWTY
jgi:hypothetical protein